MTVQKYDGTRFQNGESEQVADALAVEEALQIKINGTPFTITMRTPGDDEQLTRGLLFTEDVLADGYHPYPYEILETSPRGHVVAVNVGLPEFTQAAMQRSLISNASCGMCGKTDLCDIAIDDARLDVAGALNMDLLPGMARTMRDKQQTFEQCGGSHAAAAFTIDGEFLCIFEDIGRHNAVDKVIGSLFETDDIGAASCLFVSGRISYEIVFKAYKAGLPFLIAVSAPSSLAVDMADRRGMTIVGFCRDNRATVYANASQVCSSAVETGATAAGT